MLIPGDYAVSGALDTTLTLDALKMAIARRQPGPGIIHHSDQRVQYSSGEYVDDRKRHGQHGTQGQSL